MKRIPHLPALLVAVVTYVIVAGIFTESGVILQPAARAFGVPVTEAAILFFWLGMGNLSGQFLSIFIFRLLTIRQTLFASYAVFFAGLALLFAVHAWPVALAAMVLIGLGVGTAICAGAVIIAESARDRLRAVTFLATDCAFSGAGFVFPAVAANVIANGAPWPVGYAIVAVLPIVLLLVVGWVRLPAVTKREEAVPDVPRPKRAPGAYTGVVLFGAALAAYLMGQGTFTTWAPTYLKTVLHVPELNASTIVGSFYGPSSLGLLTAAIVVSWVSPRIVLGLAATLGAIAMTTLANTTDAGTFFTLTLAFGFTSTCMYKLMISLGSEELPDAPPHLITTLLFVSTLGLTVAPAISAAVVKAFGMHASMIMAATCYGTTFVLVALAYAVRRRRISLAPANAAAA